MQEIIYDSPTPYTAYVGSGAAKLLAFTAKQLVKGNKIAVITDEGVPVQHVARVCAMLAAEGFDVKCHAISAGERGKTLAAVEEVYGFLYSCGVTRSDAVAAVGGGVPGDVAGFAAATYMRGLGFINVPTTLIAQTDSAYGGKTGVDFMSGKNYIGSFYDPSAVICDTDFLRTLDKNERLSGMGEVIKYAAIASRELLSLIAARGEKLPTDDMIAECVRIKRAFVTGDERDNGKRRALNFGHTFGHAIEAASGYSVPHGQAVAYGILAAAAVGEKLGVTAPDVFQKLLETAEACGLDTDWRQKAVNALPLVAMDKKSDGERIDFVLLKQIGEPVRYMLDEQTMGEMISR